MLEEPGRAPRRVLSVCHVIGVSPARAHLPTGRGPLCVPDPGGASYAASLMGAVVCRASMSRYPATGPRRLNPVCVGLFPLPVTLLPIADTQEAWR